VRTFCEITFNYFENFAVSKQKSLQHALNDNMKKSYSSYNKADKPAEEYTLWILYYGINRTEEVLEDYMINQNIEFHNVDHLERVEGMSGLRLHRFPQEFTKQLGIAGNYNGRFRAQRPHGCELRFVTEAEIFDLTLTAVEGDNDIIIYYGDRMHSKHTLKAGNVTVLHVEYPEIYRIVDTSQLLKGRFTPKVWRVQFGLNSYMHFHYIDTFGFPIRPPREEEKPDILWAAYGSSITCGSVAALYSNSYVNQAAIRLNYDVLNKGLSGSCLCEGFVADYLAGLEVDVLSLELGVNMVLFFEEAQYRSRIRYFLQKMKDSQAGRVYIIDMLPNKGLIAADESSKYYVNYRCFKAILRQELEIIPDRRIVLIPGEEILKDLAYLSTDLLHPSDDGHIRMGEHLANWILSYEEGSKTPRE
jgi:lysophospholipase L1-like esterase